MQIWFEKPAGNLSFAGGPWRVNRIPSFIVSSSFLEPFFSCRPQHPAAAAVSQSVASAAPDASNPPRGPISVRPGPSSLQSPDYFWAPGPVWCRKIKREGARKRRAGRREGETWKLRLQIIKKLKTIH